MITSEALQLAALGARTEVLRLAQCAEESAEALAAAEQRAEKAEAEVKRLRARIVKLRTAPDDLVTAAQSLLGKLDTITTEQFQCGEEKAEREALRSVLQTIEGGEE